MLDRKLVVLFAYVFLFIYISLMSANYSQDDGNLDDYKICTFSGELEQIRENIWREKKECHWNPNVTQSTIELIEKWGRWPQTISLMIYAPVFLTTVILSYFAICCAHDCRYLHTLVPSHKHWAAKFWVWWKVEAFAIVPLLCVIEYFAYVTQDVVDAYWRYSNIYIAHHLGCLSAQVAFLNAIGRYHKDDHMEPEASDDTTNDRRSRLFGKLCGFIPDKVSQNSTYSTTINELELEDKPLK